MISGVDYKTISDALGELHTMGNVAIDFLDEMELVRDNTSVSASKLFEKEVLQTTIENAVEIIQQKHVTMRSQLSRMVIALQKSVLLTYDSVDEYLANQGVLVSQDFATLSSECGYTIAAENIEA